ncbi:hypothetical protein LQK36_004297 [Vibrio vulnificus]|uniref:hypothetical protein n=1 Tax=Vibrio vulnificus TaxID=672 RepID=UPI001A3021CB|nr:hypothetical protein [Vibrio vulnificus]EIO3980394.1 hypothetical protein [Vibrio vulnificus]WIL72932.1 hypothetical protein QPX65_08070 [Vibrio vulnificus]HAS6046224.1 hypothetical protein [Vibrio vulnificus]HAS6190437.1 hypothetical protein [Vibrio vulnificus]
MEVETEIILLKAIYEHINDMVNHSLIEVRGELPQQMVMFHDYPHRSLFFIRLVDFLSCTDARGPLPKTIFLKGLADICESPNFSIAESELELKKTVSNFRHWLNEIRDISIWIPSIDIEATLKITRVEAIKMSGDISKHNYLRSVGVADEFRKVLQRSGISVDSTSALLALGDFQERFGDDVLIYMASHICEFLNNIRLGIRTYLQHEFKRSFTPKGDLWSGAYTYDVPKNIGNKYAVSCYWELMNELRSKPYMEKFIVADSFRSEY